MGNGIRKVKMFPSNKRIIDTILVEKSIIN